MTRTAWAYYYAFVASIAAANILITLFGVVPLFGLLIPAGTLCAGLTFMLRDLLHQHAGRLVAFGAISLGVLISYGFADPSLAIASAAAFMAAELVDLAVFTALMPRIGRAVLLSGVAGIIVDTLIFLPLSGLPLAVSIIVGQAVAKIIPSVVGAMVLRSSNAK